MTWSPVGDPQEIGAGHRQYLSGTHSHEGGHDVALAGLTVRVLPDGHTSPRKRSQAIAEALQTVPVLAGASDSFDPVAYLVGVLVMEGARRIEVDGVDLFPAPPAIGQWRLDLVGDGHVAATFLGDDQ